MRLTKERKYGYQKVDNFEDSSAREFYERAFYSQEKPEYLVKSHKENDYWEKIWKIRLNLMEQNLGAKGRILDVGASGGFFLGTAQKQGWGIEGIEPSSRAIEYAKNKFGIKLKQGLLQDYTKIESRYNAMHLAFVLEHMHNPESVMNQVFKMLKPNGVCWVEVPNDFNLLQRTITKQLKHKEWWIVAKHHVNYFNYDSLSKLLTGVGFEELDRMASFPVELFALMGKDYIEDNKVGIEIHKMRMNMEINIINEDPDILLNMYRSFAMSGIGRTCNFLVRKPRSLSENSDPR